MSQDDAWLLRQQATKAGAREMTKGDVSGGQVGVHESWSLRGVQRERE